MLPGKDDTIALQTNADMKERGVTMANGLLQLHIDDILPDEDYKATAAIAAMKRMSSYAEKAGMADMTLEEINAEIAAVRGGK